MQSFSLNSKNKKNIEKQKKLAEEEACAEAYEEFVATFNAPKSNSKVFVRGNVINPSSGQELSASQSGKYYKPEKLEEFERQKAKEVKKNESKKSTHHSNSNYNEKPAKKKGDIKKKSNLEIFKEELKIIQEEREERSRQRNMSKEKSSLNFDDSSNHKGSFDNGDPNTTNIYLGNLNPNITENQLCEIFGRYGALASVKIMWPRSEEERIRNRNCGFVAYMSRIDAERALKSINGRIVMDYEMRLGWGKAVLVPQTPIYVPKVLLDMTKPPPPSGLPFNAQVIEEKDKELLKRYDNDPQKLYRENKEAFDDLLSRTVVKVVIPNERPLVCLIHRVVEFVVREGPLFEALLMNREQSNPKYSFLFENQSPAHIYYRWRLFSVLNGDHPSRWRTNDFRMFTAGSFWKPPVLNFFQNGMPEEFLPKENEYKLKSDFNDHLSNDSDSDSDYGNSSKKSSRHDSSRSSKSRLSKSIREELETLLRGLNPQRSKIAEMMLFCITHADCWEEIVECITDSLCINETPLYKKIARLFLVSDILHNCSVKVANVSNYRKGFQAKLNGIFESFHQAYNQIEGRLKAEHFKQRVMNCFRAWEDSAIYSSDFLIKLQNIFLGLSVVGKDKSKISSFKKNTDDIDGVPIIDPDLDGIEMEDDSKKEDPFKKKFKNSKWETVDMEHDDSRFSTKWDTSDQNVAADDDDIDGKPLDEEDYLDSLLKKEVDNNPKNSSATEQPASASLSREVLREIELKVIKYQDELETDVRTGRVKLNEYETISTKTEKYRCDLMRKALQKHQPTIYQSRGYSSSFSVSNHTKRRSRSRSKSKSPKRRR